MGGCSCRRGGGCGGGGAGGLKKADRPTKRSLYVCIVVVCSSTSCASAASGEAALRRLPNSAVASVFNVQSINAPSSTSDTRLTPNGPVMVNREFIRWLLVRYRPPAPRLRWSDAP